ncbi:MAG TPA: helix-hairpin-helix domain-containing protein [Xanthomonadaceae bacterium]|nr:helix-hairpin-helix domain-containing protein [Xanthomonadaceae bacterium]
MNRVTAMLQTVALSLLLIGGAQAGKATSANKASVTAAASTTSHHPAARQSKKTGQKVNINTADADAINGALINIGPSKAAAIVAYRKQHGAFHSADELASVKGIGLKTIAKNKDFIVVGGGVAAATSTKKR